MGRVSVVLITWNSATWLRRCLEGIAGQSWGELEVIVIDNASSDESVAILESSGVPLRIVRNRENAGFAPAANQGIAHASGEWVLLLNPDVYLAPDYVESLVRALEGAGERFGSATGKLLRGIGGGIEPTSVVDSLGIRMTRSGRHLDIGAGTDDRNDTVTQEVFGVSGAAALYRRSFLDDAAIEGQVFDENFFAYREDADLSWRGRLFGWCALSVPAAVGWHVRRVTPEVRRSLPSAINMHSVKNRFLLRISNEGAGVALRNFPFELLRDATVIGATLTVERSSLPALRWLWQHRREAMQKRRVVQSRRRVPDREIARWFRGW
ncbi:MAG: glycosyltransferase family 2 protein [Thermoanaerobaculia bacterium]